jgi:hypothetical protein
LFVILFPLGIMNIAAMAVVTLLIFAEKTLPLGRLATRAIAVALVAYGAVVLAAPQFLPTFPAGMAMPAPAATEQVHMRLHGSPAAPAAE